MFRLLFLRLTSFRLETGSPLLKLIISRELVSLLMFLPQRGQYSTEKERGETRGRVRCGEVGGKTAVLLDYTLYMVTKLDVSNKGKLMFLYSEEFPVPQFIRKVLSPPSSPPLSLLSPRYLSPPPSLLSVLTLRYRMRMGQLWRNESLKTYKMQKQFGSIILESILISMMRNHDMYF